MKTVRVSGSDFADPDGEADMPMPEDGDIQAVPGGVQALPEEGGETQYGDGGVDGNATTDVAVIGG